MVPFDDLTADVLRKLRTVGAIEMPLSDAVERSERGVVDPLHREPVGRIRQVGAGRVQDRVVVAAP